MNPYQKTLKFMVWWIVPTGLIFSAAIYPLADPDMWWHLAAGRMILEGRFPMSNTLSHTFPDYPWRFTQWLFGTLIAFAENLGGFVAVQIVVCAFAAGAFLLVIATIRRDAPQARWYFVLPLIAIGVISARGRFVPRGDLATALGLAAVHYLWVARPRRTPLFLAFIGCIWSNLHAGVVFGVLEIGIFGFAAVLDRDRKSIRDALYGGFAFFAGSLANPFLYYPYLYVLENLEIARHFPLPISELQPPPWADPVFASLMVFMVLGLIPALVRRRYRDVLLIAGSGAMAISAVRFVPFLAVLGMPGVAKSFLDYRDILAARFNPKAIAVFLSTFISAVAFYHGYVEYRQMPPGFGANLRKYPAGAADFILSKGFTGRIFNEFDQGGFLAWRLFPKQRVFIDGRGNAYPWNHFRQAAGHSRDTIESVLNTYGVDFAVVQRRPFQGNIDWGSAFGAMGWELVYVEGASFLFVRPASPDAVRARAEVFRSFLPWEKPESLIRSARAKPDEMHADLLRIDPQSVLDVGEFNALGLCAYYTRDPSLAIRFLSAGLSLYPANSAVRLNYALVLEASGRAGEAVRQYRRIIETDRGSSFAGTAIQRLDAMGATLPGTGEPIR